MWIRVVSPDICEWGTFTLTVSARTGTAVTTLYDPAEIQLISDAANRLGWTPEQLQHDSVLIWQFIYVLAGIHTPTPVPTPTPGTVAITSVYTPSELASLTGFDGASALFFIPSGFLGFGT